MFSHRNLTETKENVENFLPTALHFSTEKKKKIFFALFLILNKSPQVSLTETVEVIQQYILHRETKQISDFSLLNQSWRIIIESRVKKILENRSKQNVKTGVEKIVQKKYEKKQNFFLFSFHNKRRFFKENHRRWLIETDYQNLIRRKKKLHESFTINTNVPAERRKK